MVEILISVYNAENTIKRCLDSILLQTFTDYKVLIYDDASTDSTADIIDLYSREYDFIRIEHSCINRGPGGGKNYLLNMASEEYILFVDADDYLDMHYLENLSKYTKSDVDIIFSGFTSVDSNGNIIYTRKYDSAESALISAISNWGKLIKLDYFKKNNIVIPSGKVLDDVLVRGVIIAHNPSVVLCPEEVGYFYVVNNTSVSHTYMKAFIPGVAELEFDYIKDNLENISNEYLELYEYWGYKVSCWHLLKSGAGVGKKPMICEYEKEMSLLREVFPDYRNNAYLRGRKKLPDRKIVLFVVRTMFFLDKIKLLKTFLLVYSIVDLSCFWPGM